MSSSTKYSAEVSKTTANEDSAVKITFYVENRVMSKEEFISALTDDNFLELFKDTLCKNMEGESVWEVSPFIRDKLTEPLEMITIRAQGLDNRGVDKTAFQEYRTNKKSVTSFPSLRKDAVMIIPIAPPEEKDLNNYHALYPWLMQCSNSHFTDLFHLVHDELIKALKQNETVWLSTSGFGVAWLHVRIDTVPKYFQYGPYKQASKGNQNCKQQ